MPQIDNRHAKHNERLCLRDTAQKSARALPSSTWLSPSREKNSPPDMAGAPYRARQQCDGKEWIAIRRCPAIPASTPASALGLLIWLETVYRMARLQVCGTKMCRAATGCLSMSLEPSAVVPQGPASRLPDPPSRGYTFAPTLLGIKVSTGTPRSPSV